MKIKFKVYCWRTFDTNWDSDIKSWSFSLLPTIRLDGWKYKEGGGWFTIIAYWLCWGITFDWRKERPMEARE